MSRSMSLIGIVAAVIALAGCSDPSSNLGGDVVPAQRSFEEYPHARSDLTGEVELRSDGCWTADVGDGPLVAIFPVGSTLDQIDGVWHFVSDDGLSLTSGDRFVGSGGIARSATSPASRTGSGGATSPSATRPRRTSSSSIRSTTSVKVQRASTRRSSSTPHPPRSMPHGRADSASRSPRCPSGSRSTSIPWIRRASPFPRSNFPTRRGGRSWSSARISSSTTAMTSWSPTSRSGS